MIETVLGGRYEIIEQIGGGGMALVYKARCQLLDRFVAIKILKDEFVNDQEFIKKFRRESQSAARLSHPNIVNIYDVGEESRDGREIHYIVMEYIKGKTLKEIIQEEGLIPLDDCLNYSCQIADALEHAHENHIFHRDIKPHNIMITEDNTRVKVTDFGIARAATSSTVTASSDVLGSVHYFSPEQARGGYTDDKSDIYSLGIVMYEMATGQLPYEGESPITVALKHVQENITPPRKINPKIPQGFEQIILKAVQKRQADRYANISDLIKDLRRIKINKNDKLSDESDFDSHTRLIPAINIEEEIEMKEKTKKKNKKKSSGILKAVLLGIIMAFLLAGGIFFGYFKLKDMLNTEEVTVPNIVSEQEDIARDMIEKLGLKFVIKDRVRNENFKSGQVTYQSVDPDTVVKSGFPIEVTIAEGEVEEIIEEKDPVPVPDTVHKDIGDARELIMDAELKIDIEYEHSDDVPVDVVIRQTPDPGNMVEVGTRVTLVVSQGEDIKNIKMEKLVGENIEEAKRILKRLDLVEGDIVYQPDNEAAKDVVVWQSYEPGTEIQTKTAVDLYVSNGELPEPEEEEETAITFTIPPLQDREETRIKIIRIQDGASIEVYNMNHLTSAGDVVITLYGKSGAQFEIYYDDVYETTITK